VSIVTRKGNTYRETLAMFMIGTLVNDRRVMTYDFIILKRCQNSSSQ